MTVLDQTKLRAQVERLAASAEFARSDRMVQFLRYVIDKTLDGDTAALRERQIGISIFERPSDWDPKLDNIVRSEARRLRNKLDAYAASDDPDETVRVTMPTGGYSIQFEERSASIVLAGRPDHSLIREAYEHSRLPVDDVALPLDQGTPALTKRDSTYKQGVEPEPAVQSRVSPTRQPIIFTLSAAICLLIVAIVLLSRHQSTPEEWGAGSTISPLTSMPGESFQPSVSPDGKSVAFVWNDGGSIYNVYVIQPGGRPLRVTSASESDLHPVWSPDGSSLAFLRESPARTRVMLVPFPGGQEKLLFTLKSGRPWSEDELGARSDAGPSWSSDGQKLVVSDMTTSGSGLGLFEYDIRSRELRALTDPASDQRDLSPAFSPDGKWIAFTRFSSYDSADVFVKSTADHTEHQLSSDRTDISGLAWQKNSQGIIFSSNRDGAYGLWQIGLSGRQVRPIPTTGESAIQPAIAGNGKFIAYADSSLRSNVLRVDLKSSAIPVSIAPATRRSHSAQFSPDGSKIAFVSDRSGKWQLWISDSNGTNAVQLTDFHGAAVGSLRWSPDGKFIVFDARPNGRSAVYIISADGQQLRNLSSNDYEEKQPAWSPDGKWIYFDSNRSGSMRLWRMSPIGSDATLVSSSMGTDVRFSPDGNLLFFTGPRDGLWQMSVDGTPPILVRGLEKCRFGRLWTTTDRGIYFVDINSNRSTLKFYDFRDGSVRPVLRLPGEPLLGYPSLSYSASTNSILFAGKDDLRSDLMILWAKP